MVYKILIAEDEVTMRRLMATLLKRHNHEIIEAGDGEAAFALAHEHQPDIILLDVMMPLSDGFETVRRLRANPDTESIPVIFLSAKGQVEDRVEGLRLGGDDYIIKPAEPAELLARIDSVILRSRREARRRKGQVFGFIGAKGGVYPCWLQMVGNVREHSLKELRNNEVIRAFRQKRLRDSQPYSRCPASDNSGAPGQTEIH